MSQTSQSERVRALWIASFNKLPEELPLDRIAQAYESWLFRNMRGCHVEIRNGILKISADQEWKAKYAALHLKRNILKMPRAYFSLTTSNSTTPSD